MRLTTKKIASSALYVKSRRLDRAARAFYHRFRRRFCGRFEGNENIDITITRTRRKTTSLEVSRDGRATLRCPLWMSQREANAYIESNRAWLEKKLSQCALLLPAPSGEELAQLRKSAAEYIPPRVRFWEERMGLEAAGIRITAAKKRYGSCSAKNRLCFSFLLMRHSPDCIDAILIHELAHIVHKNHGRAFYALVESFMPDYRQKIKKLRSENYLPAPKQGETQNEDVSQGAQL